MSDAQTPEVDYGPLAGLVGTWTGDKGLDVAPEPDGKEENPYYETIVFEAAGDLQNAEKQTIAIVRYHQVVQRKSNDEVFHDQTGYWMWDAENHTVMHSIAIPRGLCLVAGGELNDSDLSADPLVIRVAAADGDPDWGIAQSPFLRDNAKTVKFLMRLEIGDGELVFSETTSLQIYGRDFEHTDDNVLQKHG
jgi:hypothetical protein